MVDPVDGEPVGVDDVAVRHDRLVFALVDGRFVDALVVHVAPEQHARLEVEIERRRAARLVHDRRQAAPVEREAPDVGAVREQERRVALVRLAARPVVRVARVARRTLAFEVALLVDAHLRADARLLALVNICQNHERTRVNTFQ